MKSKTFLRKQISWIIKNVPGLRSLFKYYHFHSQVRKALHGSKTVLDLGCGVYSYADPITKEKGFHSTGIDLFQKSIDLSKSLAIHDDYKLMDALTIDKEFKENSFDTVIALDLIEHLTKEDGEKLLQKMEFVAKHKVIIFTPNGFLPQEEHYGNSLQVHLSGWTAQEMQEKGYKVLGFGGLKWLRPYDFDVRFRPKWFWWILSDLSTLFVRNNPEKSFCILCVKTKE